MAPREQILAQLRVFEELAVERNPYGTCLIADRLAAAGQVNDRKSTSAQRNTRLDVRMLVVGTTMRDRPCHRPEPIRRKTSRTLEIDGSGYSAHDDSDPSGSESMGATERVRFRRRALDKLYTMNQEEGSRGAPLSAAHGIAFSDPG
jgi:hypothetical protein